MSETATELEQFHAFIGEKLRNGNGASQCTPEESVAAFREYQAELQRLRAELAPALERARRGEGREIDFDELLRRCRERYANNRRD
jgi:hypothetical protein